MVKCLSDNTGHGPASCPAHHLRRHDGVQSFDYDDLYDAWLYFVNIDYNDHVHIDIHINTYKHVHVHVHIYINVHINVHNDIHNNYIHYYNSKRVCPRSRSNSWLS
ncbi:hypothetical protein WR25_22634 [Diploscapter pachys]|uniref:Uncharacterized protein n=1 Tax=Diploscapter pachys TaxID=2018661 RepID=A0A2A2KQ01_9BILA|nr:hypothetical protein WR25_22634 [Diploscapter pachys]